MFVQEGTWTRLGYCRATPGPDDEAAMGEEPGYCAVLLSGTWKSELSVVWASAT